MDVPGDRYTVALTVASKTSLERQFAAVYLRVQGGDTLIVNRYQLRTRVQFR